jgi:hypothetical protein
LPSPCSLKAVLAGTTLAVASSGEPMVASLRVNAKALSTYLGHSSIQITLDRYGHLTPGNEDEAVALVDVYLERAANLGTILGQSDTVTSGFQRSRADN